MVCRSVWVLHAQVQAQRYAQKVVFFKGIDDFTWLYITKNAVLSDDSSEPLTYTEEGTATINI